MTRIAKSFALAAALFIAFAGVLLLHAQSTPDIAALRSQLREHYQIAALDDRLALVPRSSGTIKLIEIRNGTIIVDGTALTAREARQRLGRDADPIIQATYLDAAAQRALAAAGNDTQPAQSSDSDSTGATRTESRRGDVVRFAGNITVTRDERVEGDVVAIGGSADVDGEVLGEVTVIGGTLRLGPDAIVRRDVTVVGGTLNRDPGARVYGKVSEVGMGARAAIPPRGRVFPRRAFLFPAMFSRIGGFFGTLLRIGLLILLALIVVVLGGRFVDSIAARASAEPLRSGLAGLLAEILFVPLLVATVVLLAVSIIGIPLLLLVPFAVVLAFILMLVGFTGVSTLVGRYVANRFGMHRGPYASVALGVLAVVSITLLARLLALVGGMVFGAVVGGALVAVGAFVEYVAWTIGLGASILTWLSSRHHAPAAPASPASPLPAPGAGTAAA